MDSVEFPTGTLYHGDCFDVMATLLDGCVDLVLTDPPFGVTAQTWDNRLPFKKMWNALKGMTAAGHNILLFGTEPFSSELRMSNTVGFRYDLIWAKNTASQHMNANIRPLPNYEIVSVFMDRKGTYNPIKTTGHEKKTVKISGVNRKAQNMYGKELKTNYSSTERFPKSILYFDVVHNKVHSNQKPVPLLSYLIKTYTNEGDTVLDFTMGSGSTYVAAVKAGRRFIGIEKERKYFDIAVGRVERAYHETSLLRA